MSCGEERLDIYPATRTRFGYEAVRIDSDPDSDSDPERQTGPNNSFQRTLRRPLKHAVLQT